MAKVWDLLPYSILSFCVEITGAGTIIPMVLGAVEDMMLLLLSEGTYVKVRGGLGMGENYVVFEPFDLNPSAFNKWVKIDFLLPD